MEMSKADARAFQDNQTRKGNLVIWSVTYGTKDLGNRYAARPIIVPALHPRAEDGYLIADTLDELRAMLPLGLTRLARNPVDDPVLVETWL